jgi:hypothetical protein
MGVNLRMTVILLRCTGQIIHSMAHELDTGVLFDWETDSGMTLCNLWMSLSVYGQEKRMLVATELRVRRSRAALSTLAGLPSHAR